MNIESPVPLFGSLCPKADEVQGLVVVCRFFPVCNFRTLYPLPNECRGLVIPRKFCSHPPPERRTGSHYEDYGLQTVLLVVELLKPRRPRRDNVKMVCRQEIPEFRPFLYLKQADSFCLSILSPLLTASST
jgi:hypothetical protein